MTAALSGPPPISPFSSAHFAGAGVPGGTGKIGFLRGSVESKQLNTFCPVFRAGSYLSPTTLMYAPQYGGAWPMCPASFQLGGTVRPPAVKAVKELSASMTACWVRFVPAILTPCTKRAADSQP